MFERRKGRQPEEAERKREEEEARRRAQERAARRRLQALAAVALAVAAVMAAVVIWALGERAGARRAEASARTASQMASIRELLARNQPAPATRLLLEVSEPERVRGWIDLAIDVLAVSLPRPTLRGHADTVLSAAWSPDGTRIVTASEDKTARVWNADGSGSPILLIGHAASVWSAAWSPDGTRIITASYDKTARIWRITIPDLHQALRTATTDCLLPDERQTYLDESEAAARKAYEACERSYGRTPFYPDAKEH